MDAIVSEYVADFEEFKTLIGNASAIVAGSSALAGYLIQEGIAPGFSPTDIDIFIPSGVYGVDSRDVQNLVDIFAESGFTESDKFTREGYDKIGQIDTIISMVNGYMEIQIIVVNCGNIIEYIKRNFDISVCISWWDYKTNRFETMAPEFTRLKQMYTVAIPHGVDKRDERIQKYIKRGFTLVEPPCPIKRKRDARQELSSDAFVGVIASDIIQMEDIPLTTFLNASEYNIVLKAGEKFYAFDRRFLTNYMMKKKTYINDAVGSVYETPLNQCIKLIGLKKIKYADYSIYELIPQRSEAIYNGVKSLFSINCYSVGDFLQQSCTV